MERGDPALTMNPLGRHVEPGEPFDLFAYACRIAAAYARQRLERARAGAESVERALAALNPVALELAPVAAPLLVAGGGPSLAGRVHWLLANSAEPFSAREVAQIFGINTTNAAATLARMRTNGQIQRLPDKRRDATGRRQWAYTLAVAGNYAGALKKAAVLALTALLTLPLGAVNILPNLGVSNAPAPPAVQLTWNSVGTNYNLYASGASNGPFTVVGSYPSNTATVWLTNLPAYYRVSQTAGTNESDVSNMVGVLARDERLTVTGQHAPDVQSAWADYPAPVWVETNVSGAEVMRLRADRVAFWRTMTAP